ncbi:MAG: hypothetical protein ACM31C_00135 [Acidobacteriota bacterium]
MRRRGLLSLTVLASCGGSTARPAVAISPTTEASARELRPVETREGHCTTAVIVEGGVERGEVCEAEARARGYSIVDLTDTWTPALFAPAADGQVPSFHDKYLALAAEHDERGRPLDGEDALDELYGVVPALSIVQARLADDARHACHAAIDVTPIAMLDRTLSQDDRAAVDQQNAWRDTYGKLLAKQQDPEASPLYAKWKKLDDQHTALVTAEQVLRCEGWLLDKDTDGSFTWRTGNAVEMFQRRNFLMPTERLDADTRDALQIDSRELDFRLALRVLRERVVDATGLVEDGTAGAGPQPILGRLLDPAPMRAARNAAPMANAAPDLVGAATDAAARELGWLDPQRVRGFLDRHPTGVRVAVRLPPLPAYHAPNMELSAEIDRGDVYYDDTPPPFRRIVAHRPTLVLYVNDHGIQRPLVRWPTTIGGWADQRLPDGSLVQRWKESEVGPRLWRDLYAGPTWLPPRSTPDRDLVKNLWNGHWALKTEVFGPGPHAAYGMVLLEHLQVVKLKDGTTRLDDNGIGTHGSASVTSIVNGTSHGCHRLYNQLAVRLGDFLLRHRDHVVRGEQLLGPTEAYRRVVFHNDEVFKAKIDTRGFLYELTPPVPVTVLKGRIMSRRKVPPLLSAPAHP